MANNFVEEEFQTIERDDLNEAFYGGTRGPGRPKFPF